MAKVSYINARRRQSLVTLTSNVYASCLDTPAFLFSLLSPCVFHFDQNIHQMKNMLRAVDGGWNSKVI